MNTNDQRETIPPEVHDYAWKWLSYHAGQRLQALRFFLVFLGILVFGYYRSFEAGQCVFALIIASFGAVASLAFLALEIRNEALVEIGRAALREMEKSPPFDTLSTHFRLSTNDAARHPFLSHKLWLRAIYVACLLLFVFGMVDATIRLATTAKADKSKPHLQNGKIPVHTGQIPSPTYKHVGVVILTVAQAGHSNCFASGTRPSGSERCVHQRGMARRDCGASRRRTLLPMFRPSCL